MNTGHIMLLYHVTKRHGLRVFSIVKSTKTRWFVGYGAVRGGYIAKASKAYTEDRKAALEKWRVMLAAKIKKSQKELATMMAQHDAIMEGDEDGIRRTEAVPPPITDGPDDLRGPQDYDDHEWGNEDEEDLTGPGLPY